MMETIVFPSLSVTGGLLSSPVSIPVSQAIKATAKDITTRSAISAVKIRFISNFSF